MFLEDLNYILRWWILLFTIGTINLPLTWIIFKRFIGIGYAFAKILGILAISYVMFFLSIFHFARFSVTNLLIIIILIGFGNYYLFSKNKKEIIQDFRKSSGFIITAEILFILGLVFWSYVRAYQPDIRGLEKFMDFGFVNSALKSDYLPPADMWFAGKGINYYWFGHYLTAVLTKLSGIPSVITYNLMLATIMGFTLSSAFTITGTLIKNISEKVSIRTIFAAGIISAFLLTFAGNFHTSFYILKDGAKNYWYPDATRFIGYNPDVNDKTIHEFPIYSFVVADLHAHLINLPFVMLYIAVLWKLVDEKKKNKFDRFASIVAGFILGTFFMTSTWDFGNYLLATGVALTFIAFRDRNYKLTAIMDVFKSGITIGVVGLLTAAPFIVNFQSIAEGVRFVHTHTPLWQLAILWGFPLVLTAFLVTIIFKLKNKIATSDLFVFSLFITSWILILLPEIVYVKDIYAATHYRANTMFKLTYQAYVMFYLSSGYIAVRTITIYKDYYLKRFLVIFFAIIFYSIISYAQIAINSYYGGLKTYHGLKGDSWLTLQYPNEANAISWLNKNVKSQEYILEAPGDSYTDFDVISSYTGLPTVSGWFVHEWLWRGDSKYPQERVTDISSIYQTSDTETAKDLLQKYNVSYVIVGTFEHQKYPYINESKFNNIGKLIFTSGKTNIYKVN